MKFVTSQGYYGLLSGLAPVAQRGLRRRDRADDLRDDVQRGHRRSGRCWRTITWLSRARCRAGRSGWGSVPTCPTSASLAERIEYARKIGARGVAIWSAGELERRGYWDDVARLWRPGRSSDGRSGTGGRARKPALQSRVVLLGRGVLVQQLDGVWQHRHDDRQALDRALRAAGQVDDQGAPADAGDPAAEHGVRGDAQAFGRGSPRPGPGACAPSRPAWPRGSRRAARSRYHRSSAPGRAAARRPTR